MSMKTTVMAIAAVLMTAGVAAADDLNGDIPPQPSGVGNAVAEIANAIKHATTDVANQEMTDRTQMQKLYKVIDGRIKELQKQRKLIEAQQKQELNASVKASKAQGDDKEQQASDLKGVSDDLKAADKELADAEKQATEMNKQILKLSTTQNPTDLNKNWTVVRKKLGSVNEAIRQKVESAAKKTNHADEVIKKYGGSSTSSSGDATGSFAVTLKSWSCKKTELYIEGTKVAGTDASKEPVNVGKDGSFDLKVMIVDPRRQQSRDFQSGKATTANVKVTTADDYTLSYSLGARTTNWNVVKEEYDWKDAEGASKVDHKIASSSKKTKNDTYTIIFPTAAATNSVHGWVKGEIEWKGAQDEKADEDCSYDLTIAPAH